MSETDGHGKASPSGIPAGTDADMGETLRHLEGPPRASDLEGMYDEVRRQCDKQDRGMAGYLKSRPTRVRRMICFSALALIGTVAMLTIPIVDASQRTTEWFVTLTAYLVLMGLAIQSATRPLQLPALPRWRTYLLAALAIAATLVAVLVPGAHAHVGASPQMSFAPCMGTGLLLGIPVYATIRVFDRGNALGGLLAAAAAGLAGNFLLKFHCPVNEAAHVMAGHVSVAVIFVVGLGLVHWLIDQR